MIDAKKMIQLFKNMNKMLKKRNEKGEIGIVGGAVMCLVYNSRAMTRDVDAIFEPSAIIREIASQIALEEGLPKDWLNDGVKSYIQPNFAREEIISLSHLKIWAPEAKYMLAMKCLSSRVDSNDGEDIKFLIDYLKLKTPQEVFSIIEEYYPKKQIEPKTQFFIEEIFDTYN